MNAQPIQRFNFRLADAVCSIASFVLAFVTLPWIKELVVHTSRLYSAVGNLLSFAPPNETLPSWTDLFWICIVATLAMTVVLEYRNDLKPIHRRGARQIAILQLLGTTVSMGAVATIVYALRVPAYSRLFVFFYLACLFGSTTAYRLITSALLKRRYENGKICRRIVIAGRPEAIEEFVGLTANTFEGRIIGCIFLDDQQVPFTLDMPVLGSSLSELGDLLIHEPIDEVIMIVPPAETPWLSQAIQQCDYFRVSVNLVHEFIMSMELRDLRLANGRHMIPSIHLIPEEESITEALAWKRVMDVVLSAIALICLLPVLIAIAIAIKVTTPELPVFYRWNVVGYRGRRFTGFKFTTMVADADERKQELTGLNEMSGPVFKIRNDPRITPLGKFLRKYSLNELPQFWSVLIGDMSLVGPRPAGPHELVRYELWQKRKLSIRPGITCFWQVRGRNAITNFDDWVNMDLEYIQKRSVRTDMTILLQTVSAVFKGTGS
jgi:exopolysaccharide biosynthesis polyprenyl glycosylphosphotransferase